jgi:putative DNA primase/helicase
MFSRENEEIAEALHLKHTRSGYQGACPVCGYPSGFHLTEKNGKLLIYCHTGNCSWEAFRWELQIRRLLPLSESAFAITATVATAKPQADFTRYSFGNTCYSKTRNEYCHTLWQKSQPAKASLVETYLQQRSITLPIPATLRFIEHATHKESGQKLPLMLARVSHAEQPESIAVHRTYLKLDGSDKASVEPNKMMLGNVTGGSVHLAEPTNTLAITEGIETGLSVQQATGIPTWAALSCHGLKTLVLPSHIKTVFIFADNDHPDFMLNPGLKAAYFAAERWQRHGLDVQVFKPDEPGQDYNDLLCKEEPSGNE